MFELMFDVALRDAENVVALPMEHGVVRHHSNAGEYLWEYLKTNARFFQKRWVAEYGNPYGRKSGSYGFDYIGEHWLAQLDMAMLSDWYKDCYGCRPHFPSTVWCQVVGLEDDGLTVFRWTYGSLESYASQVKSNREAYERYWG